MHKPQTYIIVDSDNRVVDRNNGYLYILGELAYYRDTAKKLDNDKQYQLFKLVEVEDHA